MMSGTSGRDRRRHPKTQRNKVILLHEISWQFHSHEDPSRKEGHKNTNESNRNEKNAVQSGHQVVMSELVQDHESQGSHSKHKGCG